MRFAVDAWDPGYGTGVAEELSDGSLDRSSARVVLDVETAADAWRPVPAPRGGRSAGPGTVLFVDGVRRIDARVWIEDGDGLAGPAGAWAGLAAGFAAGAVCCCPGQGAHLLTTLTRQGLFTVAEHATDVHTTAGTYRAHRVREAGPDADLALSAALQARLGELEVRAAADAREELAGHSPAGDDLLVVDGPLRGRTHLPRALGFVKTHRAAYLPPKQHAMVADLAAGERTPVFLMGTSWDRHSWYLRLPGPPGAGWAGVVRLECSADVPAAEAVALATTSQAVLPAFAGIGYKDPRAPQNLVPIGALERRLRHRLGDPALRGRALRQAAVPLAR